MIKSVEKKQPRLQQLEKLYQKIQPYVTESAKLHKECSSIKESETNIRQKFTFKLEELNFIERQIVLINDLLKKGFTGLQSYVNFEERKIGDENVFTYIDDDTSTKLKV